MEGFAYIYVKISRVEKEVYTEWNEQAVSQMLSLLSLSKLAAPSGHPRKARGSTVQVSTGRLALRSHKQTEIR